MKKAIKYTAIISIAFWCGMQHQFKIDHQAEIQKEQDICLTSGATPEFCISESYKTVRNRY